MASLSGFGVEPRVGFLLRLVLDLGFAAGDQRVEHRDQRLVQVGHALAVLGRDLHRRAEAELVAFGDPALAGAALGLVGDEDQRRVVGAQPLREVAVERGDAGTRVEHQQRDVAVDQRGVGLRAHPPGERRGVGILEPGGVDDAELEVVERRVAFAPVAGDAGRIVDERQLAPDEAVEQGRFADVGAADDDDGGGTGGHRRACSRGSGAMHGSA